MIRRYVQLLLIIGALALAGVLYAAWYKAVEKESANAISLAGQIASAKQEGARAEEAQKELQNVAADEAMVRAYFVRTDDVVPFLESLQKTGGQFGSTVEVVSVSTVPATPHAKLSLALHITGPFRSVIRTVGAIEYQPYDTVVDSITLDTAAGAAGPSEWTAAMTLSVGTASSSVATSTKP